MAETVLTHEEDDGQLSVFASGNTLVFSCEHGHYWVVKADQQTAETVRPVLEKLLPRAQLKRLTTRLEE